MINEVDAEEYLKSVISSEMRSTSSMELLKAHAVAINYVLYAFDCISLGRIRLVQCESHLFARQNPDCDVRTFIIMHNIFAQLSRARCGRGLIREALGDGCHFFVGECHFA